MSACIETAGRLTKAVATFVAYIESLPPEKLGTSPDKNWWPRETLSHLVFWHEQYAHIAGALIAGQSPELPVDTFIVCNARAAEQEAHTPIPDLLQRFTQAQMKLAGIAADERATELRWCFRKGAKLRRFEDDQDMIARHILGHIRQLRRRGFGKIARREKPDE